jgi:predicted ATPase
MIEPTVSLALTLESNPGVYACLLGSGVSATSGIPTGWGIVVDLIQRVARSLGEDPGDDPAGWYEAHYGEEPNYSKLLDEVARSPTERARLLRSYFEPTEEERRQGLKEPTPAHRALATLAKRGVLRMFVTTNFDRLLERALEDENLSSVVVSSADSLSGTSPLTAGDITILKVNGDYLDTRIKNTPDELSAYDPAIDSLLDRIFADFGLIISGWSGEWDTALVDAFERCTTPCYSTYWAGRRAPKGGAARIMARRKGHFIPIEGADHFFTDLAGRLKPAGARNGAQTSAAAARPAKGNLPSQVGTFIGRAQTLDELDQLLDKSRLVTVHGVGGAGKTRAALELGHRRLARHPDGVWFVELASMDADRVEVEVAAALRLAPDRIETTPIDPDALLLVDSCEHVQEAVASIIERLLKSLPRLRVLVTSRTRLSVPGEVVYALEPLGLPASGRSTVEELERSEAVQLFVERARDVDRRFELTSASANAVARIVRQVDGIPLALELAAARVRTIPVETLADRLDDIFKVLRRGHKGALPQQTTLRGVGDWSWALLSEEERRLFERVSVFRDGFSLRAAEAVAADSELPEDEILDTLGDLIDKAVVTYQPGTGGRYRLLEPTRQYAAEKLEERADTRRFEDAHARYYLERLQEASPHLKGADTAIWLPRLLPNLENFRAAAERLLEHGDPVQALEFVVAGAALWFHRRLSDEALGWLERARPEAGPLPAELQARVHRTAGFLDMSNPARARGELDAAIAKFAELGLEEEVAEARVCRMIPVVAEGEPAAFIRLIEELGAFYEPRPDSWFYGHLPAHRAVTALHDLNLDLALAESQESLRRVRASGDLSARMSSLVTSMHVYRLVGEHATADELAQETVAIGQKFDPWLAGTGFAYLALSKWLGGERLAARELAMKALGCYATMNTLNLVHVTKFRRIRVVTSTEPRFADYENLVRLPPRAGALALVKGMFDELAMLDSALGREELAAEFREAADELNAEFEAALQTSSQGS